MKRIATAAAAALTLVTGVIATSDASAAPAHQRYEANRNNNAHQWRRGERLTPYYQQHYRQVDWQRDRLRAPPRGYHYVRDDRGDTLLVAVATGAILRVILAQ